MLLKRTYQNIFTLNSEHDDDFFRLRTENTDYDKSIRISSFLSN